MKEFRLIYRICVLVVLLASSIFTVGCQHHVTVSCQPTAPPISGFDVFATNGLGYLNVGAYGLGSTFQINKVGTNNYVASFLGTITPAKADITSSAPGDQQINVAVTYDISGDVSGSSSAAGEIKAQAEAKWGSTLNYNVTGLQQDSMDVMAVLGESGNKSIHDYILANPARVFMVLNPVNAGTNFKVVTVKGSNDTVNVSLGGWGGTATVTYSCNASTLMKPSKLGDTNVYELQTDFVQAIAPTGGTPSIQLIGGYQQPAAGVAVAAASGLNPAGVNPLDHSTGTTASALPAATKDVLDLKQKADASGSALPNSAPPSPSPAAKLDVKICDKENTQQGCVASPLGH
jgi:hypothetical protein